MLLRLVTIVLMSAGGAVGQCISFDGSCTGPHGSQGECCPGFYCHRPDPDWANGRCYEPVKQCGLFDDVCAGEHGTQGTCCDQRLYCHKNDASWAQGRCYRRRGIIYRPQNPTRKPITTTTTTTTTTTGRPATESQPMSWSIIPGLSPSASVPSSGGDDVVIEPGLHMDPNLPDNPDMGFDRK